MLKLLLKYKNKEKYVTVYHRWDIDEGSIVTRDTVNKESVGCYYEFDDGSGWYSIIRGVSDMAVRTELRVVRRNDYIHQSIPNFPGTNYSGAFKREEHKAIMPYKHQEFFYANRLIAGYNVKYITPRIKMIALEKLKQKLIDQGVNEQWIADNLVKLFESKGTIRDKLDVIKSISRIHGMEIDRPLLPSGGKAPLLQQFNQFNL